MAMAHCVEMLDIYCVLYRIVPLTVQCALNMVLLKNVCIHVCYALHSCHEI